MNRIYNLLLMAAVILISNSATLAQTFCDSTGNLAIFSNYDGGILRINVDANIPNLKICIVSYENDSVILSGAYLSNVTRVMYVGYYNSSNVHCGATSPRTKTINGAPPGTDTIIFSPPAVNTNPNGWPDIICNSDCNINTNQGGCNTADQIAQYFFSKFPGSKFLFHYTQYGCWGGTYNISGGGNCCATGVNKPTASFQSSDTAFCDETGKCLKFTDKSSGSPTSWKWLFPGATPSTSTLQNPDTICYNTPGTYPVTLIVTNAAGTDTLAVSSLIILEPPPSIPVVTVKSDTLFSTHAYSYQWYRNGTPIAGATDSIYIFNQTGLYAVMIGDALGCTKLSAGTTITSVAFSYIHKAVAMNVFPNPASGELTLSFTSNSKNDINVIITDVLGNEIANKKLTCGEKNASSSASYIVNDNICSVTLSINGFSRGVYFVRALAGENEVVETKRVVVE